MSYQVILTNGIIDTCNYSKSTKRLLKSGGSWRVCQALVVGRWTFVAKVILFIECLDVFNFVN